MQVGECEGQDREGSGVGIEVGKREKKEREEREERREKEREERSEKESREESSVGRGEKKGLSRGRRKRSESGELEWCGFVEGNLDAEMLLGAWQ